nr:PREDICTED: uncharacterized protein LOC104945202 [Notothenia coriiceps]
MAALPGDSAPASPCLSMDLQAVCQRAASRLDIPWPEMAKETSRSRYEGKTLPQAARTKRQLLPVFPEMLDEVSVSWRDRPFSNKAPIQGASSLDCDGMERLSLLRMPPMEPLVAAHLQPRLAPTPSRNPTLPVKADRFQSVMTERAYKATALSARALNVSSLLTAYQAELCEDLSSKPGPAVWDEIAAITDICLRVQRCAVQATGKVMGIMVVQERARWLNLTNLPDREKEDVLDMPIVPEGTEATEATARPESPAQAGDEDELAEEISGFGSCCSGTADSDFRSPVEEKEEAGGLTASSPLLGDRAGSSLFPSSRCVSGCHQAPIFPGRSSDAARILKFAPDGKQT